MQPLDIVHNIWHVFGKKIEILIYGTFVRPELDGKFKQLLT